MKVLVVSAKLRTFWYSKFIGKIFEVKESNVDFDGKKRYELVLKGEYLRSFIRHEDSEKIE